MAHNVVFHAGEQGSPEWFLARLGKVTASRFADVMTKGRGGAASKKTPMRGGGMGMPKKPMMRGGGMGKKKMMRGGMSKKKK